MKDTIIIVIGLLAITVVSFAIGLNYGKSLRLKYNPPTIVKPESPQIHFHYYTPQNSLKKKNKLQTHYSQFSWVNDNRSNEPKKDDAAWKASVRIADDVLNGRADFLEFDEVTHYHADYVNPYWSGSMEEVATIDQHVFYRN